MRDPESAEERFARVKVPELLPRFLPVGDRGVHLPLERVIRHFLPRLFPKMEIRECSAFRVTRDADFEVSDEADDLLEAVEFELRRRRFGDVIRVEISASASARILERLKRGLRVGDDQIYLLQGLLDLADLAQFVELDRPELRDEPWYPVTHARLSSVEDGRDQFAEIAKSPILVHLNEARLEVERGLTGLHPPLPQAGLAAGGSARALRKLFGPRLGPEELAEAFELLDETPSAQVAEEFGLTRARARTLAGGALILSEIQRRLGIELEIARGGLREGALRSLLAHTAAA